MQRYGFIALTCILVITAIAISAQNGHLVNLVLAGSGATTKAPLGVIGFLYFFAGALSALSLWSIRLDKARASDIAHKEWDRQDEKLAKEIRSDREKQLEAKIETLEIALKSALKKSD